MQPYTYLGGKVVYLTTVESYSHFFILINSITWLSNTLKKWALEVENFCEGETKTLEGNKKKWFITSG